MPSYNYAIFVGHLTRDPELKTLPNGTTVCNFSIAVNESYGDTEYVSYIDCSAFGKTGEATARHMAKGSAVLVAGSMRQERWQAADGTQRSRLRLRASTVKFLTWPNEQQEEDVPF